MIASKKKNTAPCKSKGGHIRDTLDYILRSGIHGVDADAVAYSNTMNMKASVQDSDSVFYEMFETAQLSKRVKNPMAHIVFSFHEGEHPTPAQVDEAVKIALDELGYTGLQCAYALHTDHAHHHIHLAVNRVDPKTGTCRSDSNDVVKLHRAIARIEKKQGWQREKRGRFEEIDGEIFRTKVLDDDSHTLSEGAAMIEKKTGLKSVERLAVEDLKPIISSCKSWSELHERLALKGFEYKPKGGGAVIVGNFADGQTEVKASSVSNKFSLKKLEKILGTFVASTAQVVERRPEPLAQFSQFKEIEQYIDKRIEAKKSFSALLAAHEARKAELSRERKEIYDALRSVPDPEEKKVVLAAFRQVFSEYTTAELERITTEYQNKLKKGKEVLRSVSDLETWLSLNCPQAAQADAQSLFEKVGGRTVERLSVKALQMTPMPPDRKDKAMAFAEYHNFVGADRYRVTVRRKSGAGFVLGKKGGQPSEGFTAQELLRWLPTMDAREKEGAHIYLTPLSQDAVHILVDDMSTQTLAQMKSDGFTPGVVIESSPGNYQSIFTIPRPAQIDAEEMKLIANAISRGLNAKYGDVNLSGHVHAHRAPGFHNVKDKYKTETGAFPLVKIVEKNQGVINEKLLRFIGYEHELYQARMSNPRPEPERVQGEQGSPKMTATAAAMIYAAHRADIVARGYCDDESRIDAMIAQRLVVTGHNKEEAAAILSEGVDRERDHDWQRYVDATVAWAYDSVDSEQTVERLATSYREEWRELESMSM